MAFPSLNHIDLKLLTALEILLEERSISRTADRINLSQSAMSRVLNRLRDLFDDPLFERTAKGMVPTARALELEAPLKLTLEQLNNLFQESVFDPHQSLRNFRIQTTNYQAQVYIPAISEAFYSEAPNAQLEIIGLEENSLLNQPITTSDLVLCSGYFKVPKGYHKVFLGHETFRLIMSDKHPLSKKRVVSIDDYLQYQHVLVKMGGNTHVISDSYLGEYRNKRRFGFRTPFFVGALETVSRTDLLFSTSGLLPQRFKKQFGLISKKLPFKFPEPNYFIAWSNIVDKDPGLVWLRELCMKVVSKVIPHPNPDIEKHYSL